MGSFFNKYKDMILPLILIIMLGIYTMLTWGKWGHIIYDCFREAIIPQALLDGKILYKDITNLYPPLGYQFNALLFSVFGNSLNTLYWAGIINLFLVLSIIYCLVKKYSSNFTAFITVFSIMEIFVFRIHTNTTASWFFPYSYSFIYAFSACLLSVFAYILYKENSKLSFLYISLLFAGLSTAFKFDFILILLIPLWGLIKFFIRQKTLSTIFIGILCFTAPFLISILIYLITGGTLFDLQNEVKFLLDFSRAPSVIAFNKDILPQTFYPWIPIKMLVSVKYFLFAFATIFIYAYFSIFIVSKLKSTLVKSTAGVLLFWFGYSNIIKFLAIGQYTELRLHTNLIFVSYFVTISAIVILITKFLRNKRLKTIEFSNKEKFYLFITLCAALMSFRSFASLHISHIGNFIIAIWWINFVYFFMEILPSYFPNLYKIKYLKKTMALFFIGYGLSYTSYYIYNAAQMNTTLISKKGTFKSTSCYGYTINETIKFIEKEIPERKTFLAAEEGLILNYLTNRSANLKYYALIPHMIDTYGEAKIINDLSKNPPDYFIVTNNIYVTMKLGGIFGINYARDIAQFILKNYDYIKTIRSPDEQDIFEITIFKLKEK